MAPADGLCLSVVMPIYNEAATIEVAVVRVRSIPVRTEIICVDDGSTDGTRDILRRLQAEGAVDVLVFHERNMGKGAALLTGFGRATGEVVVTQDADLEYSPQDLPVLLEPILDGRADAVFGSRFLGGPHRVLYFWHRVGNGLLTLFSNMLTNLNLTDMETGYKMVKADLLRSLPLRSQRFGIEPELTARLAQAGARIYEVPISYSGRTYAEGKKIGWRDGVSALWYVFRSNVLPPRPPRYVPGGGAGARPTGSLTVPSEGLRAEPSGAARGGRGARRL
ncbi:MAG TPA: glycosyltransferase family 2 protein [Longimicrobiaceae bacterium]|nr:glycosyltransferase family 2 protein [Longimicrobiaceae bacterium]